MVLSCSKKQSAILRGITSGNNGDSYCLSCPHSFRTKKNLNSIKTYGKIKFFTM